MSLLQATSPASFNDPFDSKVVLSTEGTREQKIDYLVQSVADLTRENAAQALELNPSIVETALASVHTNWSPTLGIYSLSELCDDILMWSHYASSHRGICLVFAGEMFPEGVVKPIIYPSNNEYPKTNLFTSNSDEQRDAILLTKAKHWEYEREWRVIVSGGPGYHAFEPDWLVGIIFGSQTSVPHIAEVKRMAHIRTPPLQLWRAKKKDREFGLLVEAIS
ncbi:MAG: DUF2971 domain-containing protein [Candidatus Binatus sp.]|uniref:DUF2971 domain-containing protein n=1 Tax=Candidatus Binatus sp. TaxID=2811406 RepID=UPI00271A5698|nr:DUF2971 domain-containing protein [Candidatus Binatus sp.]MDO8434574.1 DUF2971 domain-containing protein [Candidatus Binatus sp.]